jgi:3'-phosphoadenosine 5'-phosphosulfate sulfotransferase (PAPS reductase)/FAD synthetase
MVPNLADYDVILVNSSAGKDSQAMLDYIVELATAAGVRDRVQVVHADLGRVEWRGTVELAREQAAHYGAPFHVISRTKGDLLAQVEARRMWPDAKRRYCTSDQKRGQIDKVVTALTKALPASRVLNCLGIRAAESAARAKKQPFQPRARQTTRRRVVDVWFPIFDWSTDEVWTRIRNSGVRHHRAYDLGMPRLSCCFCVFAPKSALVLAGKHNPELLEEYVRVERKIGHSFRVGLRIADVQAAVQSGESCASVQSWAM